MSTPKEKKQAMGLMAICAILWSSAGLFIKWISWNPLLITGGRGLISGIVLALFMWKTGRHLVINRTSVLAGIGLAGSCTSFVMANKLTTAANAIVLQYTAPIFILLITAFFLKKKLEGNEILVVLFTTLGISLFFFDELSPGKSVGKSNGHFRRHFFGLNVCSHWSSAI